METRRPVLRGHFHQAAFFVAIGASFVMLSEVGFGHSFWSKLIYCFSLCNLFAVSALYHRVTWPEEQKQWMRKLDHASIYILIAGTSTPIGYLTLDSSMAFKFLLLSWITALIGILRIYYWKKSPKSISAILYIISGWIMIFFMPELYQSLGLFKTMIILFGGLLYTIGAIIYALKRPNPFPTHFGHHEIFHLFVNAAAALHFFVIHSLY